MTTKERALSVLENHRGEYVSGEDLAEELGVSRTSVWKAVKALLADGAPITAVKNRGYMLEAAADILSEAGIRAALGEIGGVGVAGGAIAEDDAAEKTGVAGGAVGADAALNAVGEAGAAEKASIAGGAIAEDGAALNAVGKDPGASQNTGVHGTSPAEESLPFTLTFDIRDSVTSTLDIAREAVEQGCPEGLVVIAREQTSGRGRRGRTFDSPKDAGVYLSLVLRPEQATVDQATTITSIAAVAACEAIEAVSGKAASIKWVNDVFVDGRKVVGILTEGSVSIELGCLEYALMGIGFDVYAPAAPPSAEYEAVAGNILDATTPGGRNRLVAAFLKSFLEYYGALATGSAEPLPHVKAYRDRCFVIGRNVWLEQGNSRQAATVLDVDDACRLIVQLENGERAVFASGEVSVRNE